MNKKGFAISIILYSVVFLIIGIFYILLGIIKARYNVSNDIKNNIINKLNGIGYIYNQFDNDMGVNALTVNPNGGRVFFNGEMITDETTVVKYAGNTIDLPNAEKDDGESSTVGTYTISYVVDGEISAPASQKVNVTSTYKYNFQGWDGINSCGDVVDGVYTFPDSNGTTCTKTALWQVDVELLAETITLPTIYNSSFVGWKSSVDNKIYPSGSSYTPTRDTEMVAQWDEIWADNISYNDIHGLGCSDVQCALEKIYELVHK